jgi:hypothetical protein
VTGRGVLSLIHERDALIGETAKALKAGSAADMPARAAALNGEISRQKKEIEALNQKIAASRADTLLAAVFPHGECIVNIDCIHFTIGKIFFNYLNCNVAVATSSIHESLRSCKLQFL